MIIFFTGAPGSGKTTVLNQFARFPLAQVVSTGRLLRLAADRGDDRGKRIEQEMESGGLLPSELVLEVLENHLRKEQEGSVLIGGYPRRRDQIPGLFQLADHVRHELGGLLVLDIPEEEAVRRISGRRVCPQCGAVYHVDFQPSKEEGVCDADGTPLELREDDEPSAVTERFEHYREQTEPVYEAFRQEYPALFHKIDGIGTPDEVFERTLLVLNEIDPEVFPLEDTASD